MTTPYETAAMLVEQLSPVDQARLVMLLAERLQTTLRTEVTPVDQDEPAFWQLTIDDDATDAAATTTEASHLPLPQAPHIAHAETQAMLTRWFGAPLPEAATLDLVQSAAITEWNLD